MLVFIYLLTSAITDEEFYALELEIPTTDDDLLFKSVFSLA